MDSPNVFSWDLLLKGVEESIKSAENVLVCFTHFVLISNRFKCIGLGDSKHFDGTETKSEILPDGWNKNFAIRYVYQGNLYILKATNIDDAVMINLIRVNERTASMVHLKVESVAKMTGFLEQVLPNHEVLAQTIKKLLIDRVAVSTKYKDSATQKTPESITTDYNSDNIYSALSSFELALQLSESIRDVSPDFSNDNSHGVNGRIYPLIYPAPSGVNRSRYNNNPGVPPDVRNNFDANNSNRGGRPRFQHGRDARFPFEPPSRGNLARYNRNPRGPPNLRNDIQAINPNFSGGPRFQDGIGGRIPVVPPRSNRSRYNISPGVPPEVRNDNYYQFIPNLGDARIPFAPPPGYHARYHPNPGVPPDSRNNIQHNNHLDLMFPGERNNMQAYRNPRRNNPNTNRGSGSRFRDRTNGRMQSSLSRENLSRNNPNVERFPDWVSPNARSDLVRRSDGEREQHHGDHFIPLLDRFIPQHLSFSDRRKSTHHGRF